jgi:hypothetical protein
MQNPDDGQRIEDRRVAPANQRTLRPDVGVMKHDSKRPQPRPSVADPRRHLLSGVLAFVRAAKSSAGVLRIALLGSLTTEKPVPKDADVLVTIDAIMDLGALAHLGRRLKGGARALNLSADIFLADRADRYLGRICRYRECHARVACQALHCGRRPHTGTTTFRSLR